MTPLTPISDQELTTMETAARALTESLEGDVTTANTGSYLLASRQLERLVTAGTLLSLVAEVLAARQAGARIEQAVVRLERAVGGP